MTGAGMIRKLQESQRSVPPVLVSSALPWAKVQEAARTIGAAG